ncbi:hypothetical protein ABZP36_024192 [Zizania latifolia]
MRSTKAGGAHPSFGHGKAGQAAPSPAVAAIAKDQNGLGRASCLQFGWGSRGCWTCGLWSCRLCRMQIKRSSSLVGGAQILDGVVLTWTLASHGTCGGLRWV